jgi:hypothetical protein
MACPYMDKFVRTVGEPTNDRGVPINQPLQWLLGTIVVAKAYQAFMPACPIFLFVFSSDWVTVSDR